MARLGDVATQIRGVSYKPDDVFSNLTEDSVILLRANNIRDGEINFEDLVYISKSKVHPVQYLVAGDILICTSSGSKGLVGKAAYIDRNMGMTFGAFCKVVRPTGVYPPYLGHFFNSPYYQEKIRSSAAGANINNIRNEHIDELQLMLPGIETQHRIAATLDKVTHLIALRKQQLAKLDELVKARFVEMFGDPVSNPMGWDYRPIKEVCYSIYGGGTPSKSHPEYFRGNIPWVSPKDMKSLIVEDASDHITEEAISKSATKLVPPKSVLMVIRSGILKHTLPVAINTVPVTINQDMKAFVPNENILPVYLLYCFKLIESDVLSGVRGVTADNIDFKEFQQRLLPVPPIDHQTVFLTFVENVQDFVLTIQQSLSILEVLKQSLMQKSFGQEMEDSNVRYVN